MIETSSKLPRKTTAIFDQLQKSSTFSGNVRKSHVAFGQPSDNFWRFFGNLRMVVGNLRKIVISVISMLIIEGFIMVLELSGVQFGLK